MSKSKLSIKKDKSGFVNIDYLVTATDNVNALCVSMEQFKDIELLLVYALAKHFQDTNRALSNALLSHYKNTKKDTP